MDFRIGFGYDSHRFGENRPLFLGGVEIPYEKGLVAHSDGDALIHALCDALLGAASLDDIGTHFPDTAAEFKSIDSKILLERVMFLIEQKGFAVNNADMTIVAEKPKMAPYTDSLKNVLARLLKISEDKIAIKAKTNEGMGFTGQGEGIATFAVVTLINSSTN
ncbi:MAG: 2-C-methyl-D-erythritol 2,4-cyclodiphosphate synthase [Bacteroidales bacterium]|nr:2-C-methyl-D-erythritol 2,4-cyclodiphosphate synthase [Bacteroidales bacterium]